MKIFVATFSIIFLIMAFQGFVVPVQVNSPPAVAITAPANGFGFSWNGQFSYTILVEDKEDGLSKYDEISDIEVFLKIKILSDSTKKLAYEEEDRIETPVFQAMKKNACFNCHGLHSKIAAPTFESIALKYSKNVDSAEKLASKIISGSKGVWGDEQAMPSHPHLSLSTTRGMVKWILKHGLDKDLEIKKGLRGFVKVPEMRESLGKGQILLIASYLDHGLNGLDMKEGKSIISLVSRK